MREIIAFECECCKRLISYNPEDKPCISFPNLGPRDRAKMIFFLRRVKGACRRYNRLRQEERWKKLLIEEDGYYEKNKKSIPRLQPHKNFNRSNKGV